VLSCGGDLARGLGCRNRLPSFCLCRSYYLALSPLGSLQKEPLNRGSFYFCKQIKVGVFSINKILVSAVVAVGLLIAPTTQAQEEIAPIETPVVKECEVGVKEFSKTVKQTYRLKNWKNGPKKAAQKRVKKQLKCAASPKAKAKMKKILSEKKDFFKLYREYRKVATFPGLKEGDLWLTWLSVPAWVVRAETNGYYGQSRWYATNPSGACGPYQLLGHTSCAINSAKDKLRHHIVAAGLPRGSWAVGY